MESLKEAKKRKETDIDKICARHYSDFLTSVRDMLDMREGSAVQLTSLIRDIHKEISETGKELLVRYYLLVIITIPSFFFFFF